MPIIIQKYDSQVTMPHAVVKLDLSAFCHVHNFFHVEFYGPSGRETLMTSGETAAPHVFYVAFRHGATVNKIEDFGDVLETIHEGHSWPELQESTFYTANGSALIVVSYL